MSEPLTALDYLSMLAEHYRLVLVRISVADTEDDPYDLASNALDDAGWIPYGVVGPREARWEQE